MNGILSRYRLRNTLVATGLALVGVLLVLLYVSGYRKNVQRGAELAQVFVAARDIPEGTPGTSLAGGGYLKKESVLKRSIVSGAISSTDQIASLAVNATIVSGEQVTVRQFRPVAEQGVLASISGNQRVMTVPGDANQLLNGLVTDGDHVDVAVDVRYAVGAGGSNSVNRVASRIILRNLLVLRAPSGSGTSITLALTDAQAEKLLFAIKNGQWWLLLRPVARPADSPESVQTIVSMLTDGLGVKAVDELTAGNGTGSLSLGG